MAPPIWITPSVALEYAFFWSDNCPDGYDDGHDFWSDVSEYMSNKVWPMHRVSVRPDLADPSLFDHDSPYRRELIRIVLKSIEMYANPDDRTPFYWEDARNYLREMLEQPIFYMDDEAY